MLGKLASPIRRNLIPLFVFLVTLVITLASWRFAVHQEQAAAQIKFKQATHIYTSQLQRRIDTYVRFLDDLSGLFESSNFVTSNEFAKFIAHANIVANYPGTNRIIYLPLVPADQKNVHEAQMRAAGFPDYRIKADKPQPEYYPFDYLYPMDALALQKLLGSDMHTERNRQEAMQKARDADQVIATAPLSLIEAPRQHASVALFAPVYHSDVLPRTILERHQTLQGYVAAAFKVDTLVNAAWGNDLHQIADVRIIDHGVPSSNGLLYASSSSGTLNDSCKQCLKQTRVVQIAGRHWSLTFTAHPAFLASTQSHTPLAILVGGLLTSLLLTGLAIQRNQKRLLQRQQHQQNQKFRSLFDQNPDAVYSFDLDGRFTEVNATTATLSEVPANELVGQPFTRFIAPESLDEAIKLFERTASGKPAYGELTGITNSGKRIEISVTGLPIIADGKVTGVFGIAKDITSRKNTENQNRQMQQFLDATIENLPTPLFVKEAVTLRFIAWNRASEELTGITRDEIIGKTVYDFFSKQDADFYTTIDREVLVRGEPMNLQEEPIQTRHQGVRLLHTRKVPFKMGNAEYLLGISEDITERRQAEYALKRAHAELEDRVRKRTQALHHEIEARKESELALRESEEQYRTIFEQAPVGIAHMGVDGKLSKVNQRFCDIVGYSAEELKHLTYLDITHPDDLETSLELVKQVNEREVGSSSREKRYLCKDGSVVWVNVTRSAILGVDVKYYLGIIEDITQRKEAEAALRELTQHLQTIREDERTRIAREIHDELGGALTAVKFDLSVPVREEDADQTGITKRNQETIKRVDNAIVALRRIMADLRPSVLDDLGLWAALEWQATEFQSRMGIQTQFSLKGDEINIEPNRATALFRIVQEALNNVAKHAQATAVNITATTHGDDIIIRIHDNGRGFRKDEQSKAKSFGILGMQERAQAFGGMIKINGWAGEGTTVSIKFPMSGK